MIQLRAYNSAAGDVPETPNLGTAGMTNLKIEAEPDGQTKVRLQDIVIPPDYRRSGIAGNMLDETVDIAKAKDASEDIRRYRERRSPWLLEAHGRKRDWLEGGFKPGSVWICEV